MDLQNRKIVIWGTGDKSALFSESIGINVPDFYIDNNIEKDGSIFNKKNVVHPSRISAWNQLYIIIAIKNYDDVKCQLEEYGLQENQDFLPFTKFIAYENGICRRLLDGCKTFLEDVEMQTEEIKCSILIWGAMPSFDKNFVSNLDKIYQNNICNDFVLISETPLIQEQNVSFPYMILPTLLCKTWKPNNKFFLSFQDSYEWKNYWTEKDYLVRAKLIMDKMLYGENIPLQYTEFAIHYFDICVRRVLESIKPKKVIMWNQFYPLHIVLDEVCKEKGIETQYLEYGSLPGTYAVDDKGQMGESPIAADADSYKALKVSSYELEKAKAVWKYLYESGLNRKVQPEKDELQIIKRELDSSRPTIFYAGQNDYESGLFPYTERTQKYHSPVYKSTMDALIQIAHIADEEGWNVVFKPHPILSGVEKEIPSNVHVIKQCNINDIIDLSDVTITILSQVGYISTIRRKPTVMLGYTQLRGKGCTYESFRKEELKDVIIEALNNGFSIEQEENFEKHIAQLLKYSLYDDCAERELRFGKRI